MGAAWSTAGYQDASRGGLSKAAVGTSRHWVSAWAIYVLGLIRYWPAGPWGTSPPAGIDSYLHWLTLALSRRGSWMERRRAASSCSAGVARIRIRVLIRLSLVRFRGPDLQRGKRHSRGGSLAGLGGGFARLRFWRPLLSPRSSFTGHVCRPRVDRLALERESLPQRHGHCRQRATRDGVRRGSSLACDWGDPGFWPLLLRVGLVR